MTNKKHSALSLLSSIAFVLYIIGVVLSGLYFNWQYAKDNGFIKWMLFGEIVPTLKSMAWPYYIYRDFQYEHNTAEAAVPPEIRHFINSIDLRNQAFEVLHPPESNATPVRDIPSADAQLAVTLLNRSLEESRKVTDMILAKMHKDMTVHYRQEFVVGIEKFIDGFTNNKPLQALEGQQLMDKFGDFYDKWRRD